MTKPLFVARLAGSQAEMGAQHGALTAEDAKSLAAFYETMPERALAGDMQGPIGLVGRGLVRTIAKAWQARLHKGRPAELVERSRHFMRAAGVDDESALLTMATMDSMQNCVSLAARGKLGPFANPLSPRVAAAAMPACSTIVAWGDATADGELLFSRNFDFPGVGVWDAAPAFVVCAPTNGQHYGFFATKGADTPVVTVVNEAGLVLAPHTRWHTAATFSGAMIVDVVHDIARRAETLEDAIKIARERPISSTWGICVGSSREKSALVLEVAGPTVEVVRPAPGASFLVCANRYRTPSLQENQIAASAAWANHSEKRERRLRQLVETRGAPLTPETLVRFMGDRQDVDAPGIHRHLGGIPAQATNVHCAVISPSKLRALVGVDQAPTCEGRWAELSWTWDGTQGGWETTAVTDVGGFAVRTRDDLAAPHDEATRAVHEASRAYEQRHDVRAARVAIERAVAAAPDDPSLRLTAAWLALEDKLPDRAVVHVHAGLATETESYRRGQLLLWGTRAARAVDPQLATKWGDELAHLSGPHVEELQAASRKKYKGKPHVNFMMADAY